MTTNKNKIKTKYKNKNGKMLIKNIRILYQTIIVCQ